MRVRLLLGTTTVLMAASVGPALATHPGANGKIAWTSTVDPGTSAARTAILVDTAPLTFPVPGENHFDPAWSADGSKLVFISRSTSGDYRIETVNSDGTGRHVVMNVTQVGLNAPSSPVWSGTTIEFKVAQSSGGSTNDDATYSTDANGSGTGFSLLANCCVVSGIDVFYPSPSLYRGQVYKHFNFLFPQSNTLRWSGNLHPITIPGQLATPTVDNPVWMPDGETIVFRAFYSIVEHGANVQRAEWFKIHRDGTGLEQLTKAEDACPLPGLQSDFWFEAAAPSPDGDVIILRGNHAILRSFDANSNTCSFQYTKGLWAIRSVRQASAPPGTPTGGPPRLVHEDENAQGRPSWQPRPGGLIVKIDDGRGNPLQGLKVEIYDATAPAGIPPLNVVARNTNGGSYSFDVPFGSYRVRATLVDDSYGELSSFDIRNFDRPGEAVWLERTIVHAFGMPPFRFAFDALTGAGTSNVAESGRVDLDDMANVYYRTKQFVDWVRTSLALPHTGAHVPIITFATSRPNGNPLAPDVCVYSRQYGNISMGVDASQYSNRNGTAAAESPENGEWHEFTHHLTTTFIEADDTQTCDDSSHGGYSNPSTCGSMIEGFAEFLPTLASQMIDGAADADYDGAFGSIEQNARAWETRPSGRQNEELAVAGLFWDLWDADVDTKESQVIGTDGQHHYTAYVDTVSMPLREIWGKLISLGTTLATVAELRLSFGLVEPTRDLDGDGEADVAPIDEIFLMHGFYPVQGDQQVTPTHKGNHFKVTDADQIGLSTHDEVNAAGTVTSVGNIRFNAESDPDANVEVSVHDASGTPLSGASVLMTVDDVTPPRTAERRLDSGEAVAVALALPPYFSYILPSDAPDLPPCDPANDDVVNVVLTARINGYDSADSFTFDNCTYWHAIAASTDPTAMSFTMTFPEDSAPPVSAIYALASISPTGGSTLGYWTLELSCNDPVAGDFASGCYRTEYRINGGPITPYTRTIELVAPGQYVVEFRSADGAANEEAFQSATYTVLPPQDSDGDTLTDAYELSIGTNPNNADTDNDGLRDDAELTRGTNPLNRDSDGDGLTDGAEVGLGTNPLLADTDSDGLSDADEVYYGTNPLLPDTDGDRRLDGVDNCRTVANPAQLDSDLDGLGNLCDNCAGASNAGQADGDHDGAGDVCDCAPADASVRAPASPTIMAGKTGGSTLVLSWAPLAGANDYAVTVGTRSGLAAGDFGACIETTGGLTSFQSAQVPAPGQLLTYLVQGQSFTCGLGSLGFGAGDTPRINTDPAACRPAIVVDRRAVSGAVVFGTVLGSYTDTLTDNGISLSVTEEVTGGNPSSRVSRLEYRFTIDVAPGDGIQLFVRGTRSPNSDDDFRFEWSTNGTTFTPVPMSSLPVMFDPDDGSLRVGEMPPTLSGIITLRVVDTNRSPGASIVDWVRIDSLLVRSIGH